MSENTGLTRGIENIKAFLGACPNMGKTAEGRETAVFDVSWGIHAPDAGKFGTWRHCIAYGDKAVIMRNCRPGQYLALTGWITTNPVYDENHKITRDIKNQPITREYLIVSTVVLLEREKDKEKAKQLSLVAQSPE
jgi:hypothetical protein